MKTSRAAVQVGVRQFELQTFRVPQDLAPGFALLRVEASGMCGTDISQYDGHTRSLGMYEYPAVLGHEAVGYIAAITPEGEAHWGVKEGDRVAVEPAMPCARCGQCTRGHLTHCERRFVYGFRSTTEEGALWGAYSEFMLIHPQSSLHLMSPDIPIRHAAMFNAVAGGIDWTVRQSGLEAGEDVVLLAPGMRTLTGVIGARRAGARNIIVVGRGNERKAELARYYGATHVLDSTKEDVVAEVKEITGQGAQRIIDFTPHELWTLDASVAMADKGATIVVVGLKNSASAFDLNPILRKSLAIKGTAGPTHEGYIEGVALINSREEDLDPLHTHNFSISDAEAAIRTLSGEIKSELALGITVSA